MSRRASSRAMALVFSCVFIGSAVVGCSVVMAARQPDKKDLSVLEKGTPRALVLESLGAPVARDEPEETHGCHETFAFEQGYSTGTKASRAVFHLAADVFTFGLWEIVGTPAEAYFDGTDVRLEVLYDENERVDFVCVYSGRGAVKTGPLISPHEMKERTRSAPPAPAVEESPSEPPSTQETSADEG